MLVEPGRRRDKGKYRNGNGNGRSGLIDLVDRGTAVGSDGRTARGSAVRRNGVRGNDVPSNGHGADGLTASELRIATAVREIIVDLGEDPHREGLELTPVRVAKTYRELLGGYAQDLEAVVNGALFEVEYGEAEMVVVSDIEFHSMCEHHMLPFSGRMHVAYVPGQKVIGLSKIPRIVDMFARRLQIQERLGTEIAAAIEAVLDPRGVMVVVEGEHGCASLRGVKKHGLNMVTTARRGQFATDPGLRDEFLRLAGR